MPTTSVGAIAHHTGRRRNPYRLNCDGCGQILMLTAKHAKLADFAPELLPPTFPQCEGSQATRYPASR
jgi:hypothetical protein